MLQALVHKGQVRVAATQAGSTSDQGLQQCGDDKSPTSAWGEGWLRCNVQIRATTNSSSGYVEDEDKNQNTQPSLNDL
jgi:hypothetical protein